MAEEARVWNELAVTVRADAIVVVSVARVGDRTVVADASGRAGPAPPPDLLGTTVPDRLEAPDAGDLRGFVHRESLGEGVPVWLRAVGVHDALRLLVYDGRSLAGWVGVLRCAAERPFAPNARAQLAPFVAAIGERVREEWRASRAGLPSRPGFVVVTGTNEIETLSPEGSIWMARPGFARALFSRLGGEATGEPFAVGAGEVRVTPLQTPCAGASQRLVQIVRNTPVETAPGGLSPAQREVAVAASAGATVPEIAQELGRAPETVRAHLREAYYRLGVSNRVELARAMVSGRESDED